jgi:hypothetical protein
MDNDMEFNEPFYICPEDNVCLQCGEPMNTHDFMACLNGVNRGHRVAEDVSNEQEPGVSRIEVPSDFWQRADDVFGQLENYAAVCVWCGHGYDIFTPQTEDEHFAHDCPNAPEQLKKTALARLAAEK